MYPQIYLGHSPASAPERQALRALALDLRARIHAARAAEPTTLLLHFYASAASNEPIDLLLLRPSAVIVGAVRAYHGPIDALPGGRWSERATGAALREPHDRTPLQHVKAQRDAVRARLERDVARLLDAAPDAHPFERMVGALICVPSTHPDSRISLDISDHRQRLKVLGLDELVGLAGMVRIGAQLPDEISRMIATEIFAGQLWHDGARFLFDLAPTHLQLRVLAGDTHAEKLLPLLEGENVLGRRRAPQQHEHRLTLTGDELISADHALITCGDDGRVTVRDTSKNGTWFTPPGGIEERVRGEQVIVPGAVLRLGMLRVRLEFAGS